MIPTASAALADAFFLGSANERVIAVKPNHDALSAAWPDMERAGTTTIGGISSNFLNSVKAKGMWSGKGVGTPIIRQPVNFRRGWGLFGLGETSSTTKYLLIGAAVLAGVMLLRKRK